jgi:hypothetical protein
MDDPSSGDRQAAGATADDSCLRGVREPAGHNRTRGPDVQRDALHSRMRGRPSRVGCGGEAGGDPSWNGDPARLVVSGKSGGLRPWLGKSLPPADHPVLCDWSGYCSEPTPSAQPPANRPVPTKACDREKLRSNAPQALFGV